MFGQFYAHKLAEQAKKAKTFDVVEATEEEMLKAFIASGLSKEKAQMQVNIQKVMGEGVDVVIGDKKYRLKSK